MIVAILLATAAAGCRGGGLGETDPCSGNRVESTALGRALGSVSGGRAIAAVWEYLASQGLDVEKKTFSAANIDGEWYVDVLPVRPDYIGAGRLVIVSFDGKIVRETLHR
jgi:hypothetical protein